MVLDTEHWSLGTLSQKCARSQPQPRHNKASVSWHPSCPATWSLAAWLLGIRLWSHWSAQEVAAGHIFQLKIFTTGNGSFDNLGDILMHPQTTFSADILIQVAFCICIVTQKLQPVTFGDCGSKSKGHHYSHFSRVNISPAVSVKWSLNIIWSREGCCGKQSGPQASCGTDQWTSPLLHTLHLCCLSLH